MTKAELIDAVTKTKGMPDLSKAQVQKVIECTFATIAKAVKRERRFAFPDFGVFGVVTRKARKGRNPRTGEEIRIKASKSVNFKPSKSFKDSL